MASFVPFFCMVISSIVENDEMGPLEVLSVASQVPCMPVLSCPKSTVPKSASGKTDPLEGASAMNSADDLWALLTALLVVKDWPVRPSVIFRVNFPPL